jgi:hypothetical protein
MFQSEPKNNKTINQLKVTNNITHKRLKRLYRIKKNLSNLLIKDFNLQNLKPRPSSEKLRLLKSPILYKVASFYVGIV